MLLNIHNFAIILSAATLYSSCRDLNSMINFCFNFERSDPIIIMLLSFELQYYNNLIFEISPVTGSRSNHSEKRDEEPKLISMPYCL